MNKIITLFAILVCGIQFSNATTVLPVNTVLNNIVTDEVENNEIEDRFYFWKVENAHGSASGYSMTFEKAQEMVKKVSVGDHSRYVIIMSNPR